MKKNTTPNSTASVNSGPSLKRQLHFWDSVAINVGIVIGVGIFRVPGEVAKYLDSPSLILLAWILGGLVSLLGVLCYAELSSCFPQTGGTYVYLREAFGPPTAFLFGWIEVLVLRAGSLAAVAYVLADYLQTFIPLSNGGEKLAAVLAIFLFTLINIAGIEFGTGVQNVLSILKVAIILGFSGVIFFYHPSLVPEPALPTDHASSNSAVLMATALIPVLFSYGGWHESTFMAGEFKDTQKDLPVSLLAGAVMVMVLYVLMNAAYLKAMTPREMTETHAIAADIFGNLFGTAGKMMVAAAILTSASGALNSNVLTGARIPFALGSDFSKIGWLGKVHHRLETPVACLLLNAGWAGFLVLWGNFEQILFFCGFVKWLFFTLAGISVFILRRKIKERSSFAMKGYPFVPIVFTLTSLILCFISVYHAPREALFGFSILLSGVPVYRFLRSSGQ